MKILQINASYKPAYVYGGPTMSVSRLSEALAKIKVEDKVEQNRGINKLTNCQINKFCVEVKDETEQDRAINNLTDCQINKFCVEVKDAVEQDSKINKLTDCQINKLPVEVKDETEQDSEINKLTVQPINKPEVEVLTTTANGKAELTGVVAGEQVPVDGVPVRYFPRLTKDHSHFSPALLWHLHQQLRKPVINALLNQPINTILIHIHAWWNLVSVLSAAIALWHHRPVVLSPRGTLSAYTFGNRNSPVKKLFHRFVGKPILKRCHFHVTSEKEKQDIGRLLNPKSVHVIPNFVLMAEQEVKGKRQETRDEKQEIFRLLFLSRIEEKKGLDKLFDALSLCSIHWELAIAGDGQPAYLEQLKAQATRLGMDRHIHWLGHLGPDEKFEVIRQHDLLVLPSHDENFANVVIESLSVGTPVLISKQVGLADYVQNRNLGWVCKTEPEILSQHIVLAAADTVKRSEIRQTAPDQIRCDFDDRLLVKQYLGMYREILEMEGLG